MSDKKTDCELADTAVPLVELPGGGVVASCHGDDHVTRVRVMEPIAEGEPINGRELYEGGDDGYLHRVDLGGSGPIVSKGPAKVTSNAYRAGWDGVFGKRESLN